MVEIGRVRVKTGNAPIEQKISAYPPQADICAFVSTSLETKRAAWRPSQGSGRPKCKREGMAEDRFGSDSDSGERDCEVRFTPMSRHAAAVHSQCMLHQRHRYLQMWDLLFLRSREGKNDGARDATHTSGLFVLNSIFLRMNQDHRSCVEKF